MLLRDLTDYQYLQKEAVGTWLLCKLLCGSLWEAGAGWLPESTCELRVLGVGAPLWASLWYHPPVLGLSASRDTIRRLNKGINIVFPWR